MATTRHFQLSEFGNLNSQPATSESSEAHATPQKDRDLSSAQNQHQYNGTLVPAPSFDSSSPSFFHRPNDREASIKIKINCEVSDILSQTAQQSGSTVLHAAVVSQQPQLLHRLLCQLPLHHSSSPSAVPPPRSLLLCEARDACGRTALHEAAAWGNLEATHMILNWLVGGNPAQRKRSLSSWQVSWVLQAQDDRGGTPLHQAAYFGHLDVFAVLWERADAPTRSVQNHCGESAAQLAQTHEPLQAYLQRRDVSHAAGNDPSGVSSPRSSSSLTTTTTTTTLALSSILPHDAANTTTEAPPSFRLTTLSSVDTSLSSASTATSTEQSRSTTSTAAASPDLQTNPHSVESSSFSFLVSSSTAHSPAVTSRSPFLAGGCSPVGTTTSPRTTQHHPLAAVATLQSLEEWHHQPATAVVTPPYDHHNGRPRPLDDNDDDEHDFPSGFRVESTATTSPSAKSLDEYARDTAVNQADPPPPRTLPVSSQTTSSLSLHRLQQENQMLKNQVFELHRQVHQLQTRFDHNQDAPAEPTVSPTSCVQLSDKDAPQPQQQRCHFCRSSISPMVAILALVVDIVAVVLAIASTMANRDNTAIGTCSESPIMEATNSQLTSYTVCPYNQ